MDTIISKYHLLSKKDKLSISLLSISATILLSVCTIEKVYNLGKHFGEFLYNVIH